MQSVDKTHIANQMMSQGQQSNQSTSNWSQLVDKNDLEFKKSISGLKRSEKQLLNLEFYFIDYNQSSKKYHLIKTRPDSSSLYLKEITDLILSYPRVHVKQISFKKADKDIFFTPFKVMKPLIIPVFDGKQFAFIFQTSECRQSPSADYELSDRFLIFIADQLLPFTLSQMAKNITKQQFQNRLKINKVQSCNYDPLASRKFFLQEINSYVKFSPKFYFSKVKNLEEQKKWQMNQYLKNIGNYSILIRLNTLHYYPILLLTLLLYYAMRQYKIILLGFKENRHIMSQVTFALKAALQPIDYCYPIIFSAISLKNEDFIDSPVPCLVSYWGEERQCNNVKERYKKIREDRSMPSALIDLNTLTSFNSISSTQQSSIMMNMNNHIAKSKEGIISRANSYVFQQLINCQKNELSKEAILFKNSLFFQIFQQNK